MFKPKPGPATATAKTFTLLPPAATLQDDILYYDADALDALKEHGAPVTLASSLRVWARLLDIAVADLTDWQAEPVYSYVVKTTGQVVTVDRAWLIDSAMRKVRTTRYDLRSLAGAIEARKNA
jgi:hypothetical protein